ncbi:unnamed protein product [Vitrella brassicaformis CCMP3155]|uniref:Uncharacterized protein n=1 Tax=Vitrella brassicaformis (strain CCMP3155) TaxID=1169540 RepID=A0A0G4F448_VITBC|nr:unnamed protein product [Vitrella brassicaformis CCMP3155]|eukprot:CEM06496.1 unnamed protein product [Vitrella brassicaformis CCMP3155]
MSVRESGEVPEDPAAVLLDPRQRALRAEEADKAQKGLAAEAAHLKEQRNAALRQVDSLHEHLKAMREPRSAWPLRLPISRNRGTPQSSSCVAQETVALIDRNAVQEAATREKRLAEEEVQRSTASTQAEMDRNAATQAARPLLPVASPTPTATPSPTSPATTVVLEDMLAQAVAAGIAPTLEELKERKRAA